MSIIDKIKVTESVDPVRGYDPVRLRRRKLAQALQCQITLLNSVQEVETSPSGDQSRGEGQEISDLLDVSRRRRVAPWWWVDDRGELKFALRYGSVRLKVKDDKETLIIPSMTELRKILPALRLEVLSGGLDEALANAADQLQDRFKSRKPAKT